MKPIDIFELNKLIWLLEERMGFDCHAKLMSKFKQTWALHVYNKSTERQQPFHREHRPYKFLFELLNAMRYEWTNYTSPPHTMRPDNPNCVHYCYIAVTGIHDG